MVWSPYPNVEVSFRRQWGRHWAPNCFQCASSSGQMPLLVESSLSESTNGKHYITLKCSKTNWCPCSYSAVQCRSCAKIYIWDNILTIGFHHFLSASSSRVNQHCIIETACLCGSVWSHCAFAHTSISHVNTGAFHALSKAKQLLWNQCVQKCNMLNTVSPLNTSIQCSEARLSD